MLNRGRRRREYVIEIAKRTTKASLQRVTMEGKACASCLVRSLLASQAHVRARSGVGRAVLSVRGGPRLSGARLSGGQGLIGLVLFGWAEEDGVCRNMCHGILKSTTHSDGLSQGCVLLTPRESAWSQRRGDAAGARPGIASWGKASSSLCTSREPREIEGWHVHELLLAVESTFQKDPVHT